MPRAALLSFEELHAVAGALVTLGVRKIRLTGGEPLLRGDLPKLIALLRQIPELDLALTTNGVLLPKLAEPLAKAGLGRITVSLDALDDATFTAMADAPYRVADVLRGIEAAERAGFVRVKVNCVVRRGLNEHAILDLVRHFRHTGHIVRFIEYMDVGATNRWHPEDMVPSDEVLAKIAAEFPLEALPGGATPEVAERYALSDGSAELGVISSVTRPFCGGCTRLRLSSEGKLYTCLFGQHGHDLRDLLRSGATAEVLTAEVRRLWSAREDRYSELRHASTLTRPRPEMSYLGG